MTSLRRLGWVSLSLAACAPFAVGQEGGGGTGTSTTSSSVASSSLSSGGTTSTSASTASQSSSSGASTSGAHVYTRTEDAAAWSRAPVEDYWPGANAPPSTGITAVADLQKFDDLFVFVRTAGITTVHRRVGMTWRDPAPLSTYFPLLADTDTIESAFHVPYWSAASSCGPPDFPDNESIRLVTTTGDVWDFDVDPSGFIFERQAVDNPTSWTTGLYGGPALPAWVIEVSPDPDLCGTLGWYINYALMGGEIYFADGRLVSTMPPMFVWEALPRSGGANPIFEDLMGEPDPTTLVAGFYDLGTRTYGFIGP